jgi:hypothetical protein
MESRHRPRAGSACSVATDQFLTGRVAQAPSLPFRSPLGRACRHSPAFAVLDGSAAERTPPGSSRGSMVHGRAVGSRRAFRRSSPRLRQAGSLAFAPSERARPVARARVRVGQTRVVSRLAAAVSHSTVGAAVIPPTAPPAVRGIVVRGQYRRLSAGRADLSGGRMRRLLLRACRHRSAWSETLVV